MKSSTTLLRKIARTWSWAVQKVKASEPSASATKADIEIPAEPDVLLIKQLGISKKKVQILIDAGYTDLEKIRNAGITALLMPGIGSKTAAKISNRARYGPKSA